MFQQDDGLQNLNTPVHEFLDCTIKDAMLLIYSFQTRHNISWTALEDLALLINTILGNESLPTSKYLFKKLFDLPPADIHLYCTECKKYFGKKENFVGIEEVFCNICNCMRSTKTKYKKKIFMTLPIKQQIISTVTRAIKKKHFDLPKQSNVEEINDVCDGEIYKNVRDKLNGRQFISLCISTDGVVVVKSSKHKSLWPIQFAINEIHPKHRFKRENIMCSAFAFGDTPDMGMFFREFFEEINTINSQDGLEIMKGDRMERFLVVPMILTMDSVAKCHVAAITQFNGHYACPYCLHPGTIIPPAKNVKYCIKDNANDRVHEATKEAMRESYESNKVVDGYRGLSPVLALDTPIDTVWCFGIDKMHSWELGVDKKFFNILLDSKNSAEP